MKQKIIFSFLVVLISSSCSASQTDGLLHKVALQYDIPARLLKAIAYLESGRDGQVWPWTLCVEGKAYYFQDRKTAEDYLKKLIAQGVTNIDVGCMQINLRWHGQNFHNPCELFSPEIAIPYAASFLKENVQKTRSWLKAALLYHSQHTTCQDKYRERLVAILIYKSAAT